MLIHELSTVGGLFALLSFWHFVSDWGFQSHNEAMKKASDNHVRARHCTIYTVLMSPLVYVLCGPTATLWVSLALLWASHFLIDTYIPVYLWAKHIRRAPAFNTTSEAIDLFSKKKFADDTDLGRLTAMGRDPLGLILMIVVDQVFHLFFLLPIAALSIWPRNPICYIVTGFMFAFLVIMIVSGSENLRHTEAEN